MADPTPQPTAIKRRKLRVHLHVPGTRSPASHMVSGEPAGTKPLTEGLAALGMDGRVGIQGQQNVMACNPGIVQSNLDRATGEWWAVQCEECFGTDIFQHLKNTIPHPKAPMDVEDAIAPQGCC